MICCPEDREICEVLLRSASERGDHAKPLPRLIVSVGRQFLGVPYEAGTLEREGPEELVVNLRAFDCVTFIEAVVVMACLIRTGKTDFADYVPSLERIRYRGGRCEGYPSRLHYFTDWLHDNGRKGIARDITAESGGIPFRKALHELTDHRDDHPPLRNTAAFRRMRIVEAACSRRTLHYVPKAELKKIEKRIEKGDIIAIATDEEGIDVIHAGLAVRGRKGLHLLHASRAAGSVVLSDITLYRYLQERRSRTGIIVGRVIAPDAGR